MSNMKEFTFTEVTIVADSQENAERKLEAALQIADSMDTEDFVGMSEFIAENPEAVRKIKSWIINPPAFIKPIISKVKKE